MAFDTNRLKEKNGKWPPKGRQIGEWQLIMAGNEADIWQYSSERKWAGSYYRESGDYHVKGKKWGAYNKQHKGYFNGVFRVQGKGAKREERDAVYESFCQLIKEEPSYTLKS